MKPSELAGDREASGQAARKCVLVVTDDPDLLIELWTRISNAQERFSVQVADTAEAASNALRTFQIDVAVLDLHMGDLCAFNLLTQVSEKQPAASLVLLSSFAGPDAESTARSLGLPNLLRDRKNVPSICGAVRNAAFRAGTAPKQGPGPGVLAKLAQIERLTATVAVAATDESGTLFFNNGELIDATAAGVSGDAAALTLLSLERAQLTFSAKCGKSVKNVRASLDDLIAKADGPARPAVTPARAAAPTSGEGTRKDPSRARANGPPIAPDNRTDHARANSALSLSKEHIMSLEKQLERLKDIKGYKASGIMHFTGEMLAYDSVDPNINLAMVGATFNDIFRSAHEASKKIGLDACRETVIVTPKGIVVMACSGVDSKAHVHFIGILAADGNSSLMKMQIEKLVPDVVAALA